MKKGTIILTPFPFTDLRGAKIRPAVIISSNKRTGEDILIAFISSVIDKSNGSETDIILSKDQSDFNSTGLKVTSVLKTEKIATIAKRIVLGEIGNLTKNYVEMMNDKLKLVLDIS